jgi:CTP:molybdopterin cytidylyltransferase MocA
VTVTAAILLAAADTEIDGRPIALLLWTGATSLIEWQIRQLQGAGVDVIEVVLGYQAERVIPLVSANNVEPVIDGGWRDGETSWLRVGASAVPRDTEAAIIARIDQPCLASVYRRLLDAHRSGDAAITRDATGWPMVAGRAALAGLRNLSPERGGIESIIEAHLGGVLELAADEVMPLIASKDDYDRARERSG